MERGVANAVLIKLNQSAPSPKPSKPSSLTQSAGWNPIVSARSGETEDAYISHLAVATNAGQLKVGSFTRGERMVKWNEVLRIERQTRRPRAVPRPQHPRGTHRLTRISLASLLCAAVHCSAEDLHAPLPNLLPPCNCYCSHH